MSNQNRDIVLFLGAGFSKPAKLPTMKEFGKASEEQLETLKEPRNHRNAVPRLIEAGETFTKFQSFCEKANWFTSIDINDMEKIFCIAETMRQADIDITKYGFPCDTDNLITDIKLWLWKIYHQCPLIKYKRNNNGSLPDIYKNLINLLGELNLWDKLTIISTNYDLIFEYLLFSHNIKPTYPFKFTPLSAVDRSSYDSYLNPLKNSTDTPLLCKLHGSINFFESSIQDDYKLYVVDDIANEHEKIGKSSHRKKGPAIFLQDAIWNLEEKYDKGLIPAIIPPTYSKLEDTQWLKETWKSALEALSLSEKILFIGYSLPDSDGFMHSLYHSAMATRTNRNPPNCLIVNKSDETFKRYKSLLCGCHNKQYNIKYTGNYFEDSWNEIESFLKSN